jgi:hypothetical protein
MARYESRNRPTNRILLYILGYLLELIIKIWRFGTYIKICYFFLEIWGVWAIFPWNILRNFSPQKKTWPYVQCEVPSLVPSPLSTYIAGCDTQLIAAAVSFGHCNLICFVRRHLTLTELSRNFGSYGCRRLLAERQQQL